MFGVEWEGEAGLVTLLGLSIPLIIAAAGLSPQWLVLVHLEALLGWK